MANKRDFSVHPPFIVEGYKSTQDRGPKQKLIPVPSALSDLAMPVYGDLCFHEFDNDLTKNACVNGQPLGERIVVNGKVTDEAGHPVKHTMIEIWQANAAGRYIHKKDIHDAPLDPNFLGAGRCITDKNGDYTFHTIKPGAYPWGNHLNAWRPNHIHFSLFGPHLASRLVTQMYFPGDPLLNHDPIFKSAPEKGRNLMVSKFNLDITEPNFAVGYEFNIVIRGNNQTPFEK